ncbi:Uu.00g146160.m01.CDS01 [Anthostomella pinea]|uniref:Uu.00g146160.m01.CDS01 n=1 Tax=Anthostomella pinea TaxID=933095 RepID=A0AAI8YM22_9PEZI|nr:Uu.00g146160.m01.CDS01 [Anthostomella pinea]
MFSALITRHAVPTLCVAPLGRPLVQTRQIQYEAFEANFNQDELAEARKWHMSFRDSSLPKGQTSYSRSSGPGGQHVNKTETKATTVWSVDELSKSLPKLVHSALRTSKYYSGRTDSIQIQAQTQRSKAANTDENYEKLAEELRKIYKERVPGSTSDKKVKKYEALEKSFRESRLRSKKQQSSKKAFRQGRGRAE